MNLTSVITNIRGRTLTYREWTPYDLSSDTLFYFTYFRQLVSLTTASIVNVACDCMIYGLLMHICCQFEILECRLKKFLLNRGDFGECVRQHERIYKLVLIRNLIVHTFSINKSKTYVNNRYLSFLIVSFVCRVLESISATRNRCSGRLCRLEFNHAHVTNAVT